MVGTFIKEMAKTTAIVAVAATAATAATKGTTTAIAKAVDKHQKNKLKREEKVKQKEFEREILKMKLEQEILQAKKDGDFDDFIEEI